MDLDKLGIEHQQMKGRLEALETQIKAANSPWDLSNMSFDVIKQGVVELTNRLEAVESRLKTLEVFSTGHANRLEALERSLSGVNTQLTGLSGRLDDAQHAAESPPQPPLSPPAATEPAVSQDGSGRPLAS